MYKRGKAKHSTEYKIKDIYELYTTEVPKSSQVPYSLFSDVLRDFNLGLVDKVINNSEGVELPFRLGHLRVRKCKVNLSRKDTLIPDWDSTNKLWQNNPKAKEEKKLVYHLNEHRGGFKYKIFWDKSLSKLKNKSFYFFIPTRKFKRTVASILKNNLEIDYYL